MLRNYKDKSSWRMQIGSVKVNGEGIITKCVEEKNIFEETVTTEIIKENKEQ